MSSVENIQSLLQHTAQRLKRTRAAESAAVAATAAAIAVALLRAAILVAPRWPDAAFVLADLPLLAAAAIWAARVRGSIESAVAAVGVVACMLATGVALVVGPGATPTLVLVTLVPLAAAVAVTLQWLRPPTIHQAAAVLDARCGLRQQLSAAAELATDPGGDTALTEFVCDRALAAIEHTGGRSQPLWRRTRATVAVLGLALAICALLAALSPMQSPEDAAALARLDAAVRTMPLTEKSKLLQQLRQQRTQSPQEQSDLIEKIEQALQNADATELQRLLQRLKSAGIDPETLADPDLLAVAGMTGWEGAGTASAQQPTQPATPTTGAQRPAPNAVGIYDPAYARLLAQRTGTDQAPDAEAPPPFVDRSNAWQLARRRAENALRTTPADLPPEYRTIIREYFRER